MFRIIRKALINLRNPTDRTCEASFKRQLGGYQKDRSCAEILIVLRRKTPWINMNFKQIQESKERGFLRAPVQCAEEAYVQNAWIRIIYG